MYYKLSSCQISSKRNFNRDDHSRATNPNNYNNLPNVSPDKLQRKDLFSYFFLLLTFLLPSTTTSTKPRYLRFQFIHFVRCNLSKYIEILNHAYYILILFLYLKDNMVTIENIFSRNLSICNHTRSMLSTVFFFFFLKLRIRKYVPTKNKIDFLFLSNL